MNLYKKSLLIAILGVSTAMFGACSDDGVGSGSGGEGGIPGGETGGEGGETGGEGGETGGEGGETGGEGGETGGEGGETGGEGGGSVTPGAYGAKCEETEDCADGLSCIDKTCLRYDELGESCSADSDCRKGACVDGACRTVGLPENSKCDPFNLCREDLVCASDGGAQATCLHWAGLGEACGEAGTVCAAPYACDYNQLMCMKTAKEGEACGLDVYTNCTEPAKCMDGLCRVPVYGDDACSETRPCAASGKVCFESKCIDKVECSSDSDCLADTYCCTEAACEVKNICLKYGEGPRDTVNEACVYKTVPGLFEADIQCEWSGPAKSDPFPNHYNLVVLPLVVKTPHETGSANSILALTYSSVGSDPTFTNESISNPAIESDTPYRTSVIRILNGENCELLETLHDPKHPMHGGAPLAAADVDNDGFVEIFGQLAATVNVSNDRNGYVMWHWNKDAKKYEVACTTPGTTYARGNAGMSIHDIDDDGVPELITRVGEVFSTVPDANKRCAKINKTNYNNGMFPALGDFDGDGEIEMAIYTNNGPYETLTDAQRQSGRVVAWSKEKKDWYIKYDKLPVTRQAIAYGDFGTPGETPDKFDWTKLDGIAEIVSAGGGKDGSDVMYGSMEIHTLGEKITDTVKSSGGQQIFNAHGYVKSGSEQPLYGGGAPTIGDFDGDGLPEVGVAYGDAYTIFDPRCKTGDHPACPTPRPAGMLCCEQPKRGILWTKLSQDKSSYATGSSLFDFEGDGATEVVYADEIYTRVYDGKTGDVLFSVRHNSRTWYEMPIIVDVDNDESAEIVMGANVPYSGPSPDPIHRGIRCEKDSDCTSNLCMKGLCRCTNNNQCNWRRNSAGTLMEEYGCVAPLNEDDKLSASEAAIYTPADGSTFTGNVCRAIRKNNDRTTGIRVMRDRLDRWASSRNIWNEQSYNITNINDDQTIPKTSEWVKKQNFKMPGMNNYRANSQGEVGMNRAPDITGKLNKENVCTKSEDKILLTGMVCNRGTKMVGAKMPASFYKVNDDGSLGEKYCTAYTAANVPVGGCMDVSCEITNITSGIKIRMISNDDGEGGRTTVECNEDNNIDEIEMDECVSIIY